MRNWNPWDRLQSLNIYNFKRTNVGVWRGSFLSTEDDIKAVTYKDIYNEILIDPLPKTVHAWWCPQPFGVAFELGRHEWFALRPLITNSRSSAFTGGFLKSRFHSKKIVSWLSNGNMLYLQNFRQLWCDVFVSDLISSFSYESTNGPKSVHLVFHSKSVVLRKLSSSGLSRDGFPLISSSWLADDDTPSQTFSRNLRIGHEQVHSGQSCLWRSGW